MQKHDLQSFLDAWGAWRWIEYKGDALDLIAY